MMRCLCLSSSCDGGSLVDAASSSACYSELVPPAVNLADGKRSTKMSRRWRPLPTSASTPSKWLEDRPSSLPKTMRALEEGEENEQRWEKGDGQRREKGGGPIGAKSSFQACW